MAQSSFFARIKLDVLKIVDAIPYGQVTSYKAIGEHIDVVPRHVAYILAMLSPEEQVEHPWFRVIGDGSELGKPKTSATGRSQAQLLQEEGQVIRNNCLITNTSQVWLEVSQLNSGVPKQTRPADAPAARVKKVRVGAQ